MAHPKVQLFDFRKIQPNSKIIKFLEKIDYYPKYLNIPGIINNINSKFYRHFIEITDDKSSETTKYYLFIKESAKGEIKEMVEFKTDQEKEDWILENQIVWLD